MHVLVVYFTKFGNTQQVAEAVAGELSALGEVRTVSADELTSTHVETAELVVMGTPTHKMNLPEHVRPILAALPGRCLKDKMIAAFDTSYEMNAFLNLFVASKRLDRKLRRLGGRRVAAPEIFVVSGHEGPLAAGELDRARAWAQSIVIRLQETQAREVGAVA